MSVIAISRASYSYGKKIAERVARDLNYQCISECMYSGGQEVIFIRS